MSVFLLSPQAPLCRCGVQTLRNRFHVRGRSTETALYPHNKNGGVDLNAIAAEAGACKHFCPSKWAKVGGMLQVRLHFLGCQLVVVGQTRGPNTGCLPSCERKTYVGALEAVCRMVCVADRLRAVVVMASLHFTPRSVSKGRGGGICRAAVV